MPYTPTRFRSLATLILALFISNTVAPTLQFAFADSTQYYVDATNGSDVADGLSPATAWQSLSMVNSFPLLQGDTVSFLCGESWTGTLQVNSGGTSGLPVTLNSYGACTGSNKPALENIVVNASYVHVSGLSLNASSGDALLVNSGITDVQISGNTISAPTASCIDATSSVNTDVTANTFMNCITGFSGSEVGGTIANNTFSTISGNAVESRGIANMSITQNEFTTIDGSAVVFGRNTNVAQNAITNVCTVSGTGCAAIKNQTEALQESYTSTISQNTVKNVGSGISGKNHGIALHNVSGVAVTNNTVNNAENGIDLIDTANATISNNMFLYSRAKSVSVVQNTALASTGNTLSNNSILQRNPDYPYIEMRDETIGGAMETLLTANGNAIYPNYKPNTSLVRTVKFGGESTEYTKADLSAFDPTVTKFEYFGYNPYTSTGTYATANLLNNPDFDTDAMGWTPGSVAGMAPMVSYQPAGTYNGGSALITPQDASPDRILMTNDAILSITAGQVYEVSGYVATTTGTINLRASLHQNGDIANLYADRVAETYATSSGRIFKLYLTASTTAADAQFSLETSNQNVAYEIDSVSVRRVSALTKNTNTIEVLILSNTGTTSADIACPGGVPCGAYVDTANAGFSWPVSVPAHSTRIVFWNNSPNLLSVPVCSIDLVAGSVSNGQPANFSWTVSNSLSNTLSYNTSSGLVSLSVADSGATSFLPPSDAVTPINLATINDVGPRTCMVQVTTTNTAPSLFVSSLTGSEDAVEITGTLSGVDYNPGDSVFFQKTSNPAHGSLTVDLNGTIHYVPVADYCGVDTFGFQAYDQYNHYADPINQPIQVECINDTPAVVDDSVTATGGSLTFDPTTNDTDPDSPYEVQTFTVTGYTLPTHGTLSLVGNNFQYIGNLGYIGSDTFQYSMIDQSGALSNTGTVTVSVLVPNTPPLDEAASYTGTEDADILGTLSGSDINNDTLSFTIATLPTHGTVTVGMAGSFTYTPVANYNGTDSFVYQVFDGQAYSSGASIDISLASLSDAPVATADSATLIQDTTLLIGVLSNDGDVDSVTLSITGVSLPAHGTAVVVGTGIEYTPTAGYVGTDSFTYQIEDETGLLSNTVTVSLNILTSNTAPVSDPLSLTLSEDSIFSNSLSGSDAEGDTLTYTIDSLPVNGTLSVTATGVFTYTPNANYYGSDSFTYHVSDAMFSSVVSTVTLTINGINDAPVAQTGITLSVSGNTLGNSGYTLTGMLSATDIDSLALTYSASTLPTHGTLVLDSSGSYIYQPALGYTGTDSFSFVALDPFMEVSNVSVVDITVVGYNSAPYAPSGTFGTFEDTLLIQNLNAYDAEANPLTYMVDIAPLHGTLILSATGGVQYMPTNNYNVTDSFSYHVTDGLLTSTSAIVDITISPVNDAPVGTSASYAMSGNTITASGYVLTGMVAATDIDSMVLTYVSMTPPSHGNLSLLASGSFQYTPDLNYVGTDTFSFVAQDDQGAVSAPVNITLTIGTIIPPVTPPVTHATTTVGPGGGGISGGVQTLVDSIFFSAPSGSQGKASNSPFVSLPGQELATQLFLLNRDLNATNPLKSVENNSAPPATRIENVLTQFADGVADTVIMRKLARIYINAADQSDDPLSVIEAGSEAVINMDTVDNERMMLTQLYVLRVFEARKRLYEEIINRDILPTNTVRTSDD